MTTRNKLEKYAQVPLPPNTTTKLCRCCGQVGTFTLRFVHGERRYYRVRCSKCETRRRTLNRRRQVARKRRACPT